MIFIFCRFSGVNNVSHRFVLINEKFSFTAGEAGKRNQKLIFSFNFPYNLAAEPQSGEAETLTFPKVWTILKLARTIFAPRFARGGGKKAQKN